LLTRTPRSPDIARLITWQRLERSDDLPHAFAVASTKSKVDELPRAQAEGHISDRFDARVLLGLIIHLAAFWVTSSPDVLAVMGISAAKRRREIVREAIAAS
jgi:hypothetical protein